MPLKCSEIRMETNMGRESVVSVSCVCDDWEKNIEILHAPNNLAHSRNPNTHPGYTGKILIYCPWCSKKLIEVF